RSTGRKVQAPFLAVFGKTMLPNCTNNLDRTPPGLSFRAAESNLIPQNCLHFDGQLCIPWADD
ncbi:MAG: hypothetical protein ACKPKO_26715, partial [Candidatus Fonsibacter sp.]